MADTTEHFKFAPPLQLDLATWEEAFTELMVYGSACLILRTAGDGQVAVSHLPRDAMLRDPESSPGSASPHGLNATPNGTPDKS